MNTIQEKNDDWATPSLKETPYWRDGMTPEEYEAEREYFGRNYHLWKDGTYEPLWKQREHGMQGRSL